MVSGGHFTDGGYDYDSGKMMMVINKQQVGTFGACVVNICCLNIQEAYVHRLDTPYTQLSPSCSLSPSWRN